MAPKKNLKKTYLFSVMIGCLFVPFAHAESFRQSYTWFDGETEKTVWLDDSMVAEFPTAGKVPLISPLQQKHRGALRMATNQGGVKLWKVGGDSVKIAKDLNKSSSSFSPVLRDRRESGRMRALPGSIIVFFNPHWASHEIESWAARRKLPILRKLEIGANIYVLKSESGLKSLETANSIFLSREVVAAYPDWWMEHSLR